LASNVVGDDRRPADIDPAPSSIEVFPITRFPSMSPHDAFT
jgi:hypothetical protein